MRPTARSISRTVLPPDGAAISRRSVLSPGYPASAPTCTAVRAQAARGQCSFEASVSGTGAIEVAAFGGEEQTEVDLRYRQEPALRGEPRRVGDSRLTAGAPASDGVVGPHRPGSTFPSS